MTRLDPEPGFSSWPPGTTSAYVVLYDGTCPVCRSAVGRLKSWDSEGRLAFLPASDPEVATRFPWISEAGLREALHVVGPDGTMWKASEAIEQVLKVLPQWRWTSFLFHLPLIRRVARKAYEWVARRRYRLSCGSHCGGGPAGSGTREEQAGRRF